MHVIDFHTHIFPDSLAQRALAALSENNHGVIPKVNGTIAGLRASMQKNGVAVSVLLSVATKASQVTAINTACESLKSNDTVPFGALHPDVDNYEKEVSFLVDQGIKGIKLHPEYQDFYADDKRYFPMYEALQAARLIVVFHAGKDPGPFTSDHILPKALKTIAENFPKLIIVAAHFGGWMVWDQVESVLAGLPVYFDTATVKDFLPVSDFVRILRKHGAEQILFGSDSPWYDQGEDIAWIDSLPLSQDEKEQILFKNAKMLLDL